MTLNPPSGRIKIPRACTASCSESACVIMQRALARAIARKPFARNHTSKEDSA